MAVQAAVVSGGDIVLRMAGEFRVADAWEVHESMRLAERGRVVLDFSQVRVFDDFAIALLAPNLVEPGRRGIRIRGLSGHQCRILEYFGVASLALEGRQGDGDQAEAAGQA